MPRDDRECPEPDDADVTAIHRRGDGATLFEVQGPRRENNLFCFSISISTSRTRDVHGFIALLMDLPSIAALKTIVNDFIDAIEKQPSGHVG